MGRFQNIFKINEINYIIINKIILINILIKLKNYIEYNIIS